MVPTLSDGDAPGRPDKVVAIGPLAVMRAIAETTKGTGIETLVPMDPLMVDGTGMDTVRTALRVGAE